MSFLRRDPATGRWVVFSDARMRPALHPERCPFCEGNESLTPPEIVAWGGEGRRPNGPGWQVRVVPNADPLLMIELPLERHADRMYDAASGTGAHEIVIEAPEHRAGLADLSREQVARVLGAYAHRIADLKGDRRIRSVFVLKNHGLLAGAGLPGHTHSQVIGLPVTPKVLKEILRGARDHFQIKERCVFCDIIREELELDVRVVVAGERFVAITPYASRVPFEVWMLPREHGPDFESADAAGFEELAELLILVLGRLEHVLTDPAYNLFLYSGPNRKAEPNRWKTLAADFHWHIQILPRLAHPAGFELGSGFHANPVTPEQAAAALRVEA